jgi:hypothetical protein
MIIVAERRVAGFPFPVLFERLEVVEPPVCNDGLKGAFDGGGRIQEVDEGK